ncbi:aromatic acid exporter family protein [Salinibacterium sp. ZJ450]|uniref:FUSC family protein n=1 Tax=Salinibacterium sp. ZJ450 TaxID=2708338 RepID=UPI0014217CD0|nr:FUSC family protein [Salinibacterium sp. ZJ450]
MTSQGNADRLRRLERSIRWRVGFRMSLTRVGTSLPAIGQIVIAALLSYAVAHYLLGHAAPVLAVTVVVSSLGFGRDARPRRILESAVGMLVGITLSETLWMLAGSGAWQIAVALAVTLVVARFSSPSNAFAVAAGVQSMMVMIMPAPDGGVYVRSLDGLIGGIVALIVTALIPRDPSSIAQRDGRRLYSTLSEALDSTVDALRTGNEAAAALALERLRRTQVLIDDWTASLDSAVAIARISPFLRRHLPALQQQKRLLTGGDLSVRHLRLFVRRVMFLVRDAAARPELARVVEGIAGGVVLLGDGVRNPASLDEARSRFAAVMRELDPTTLLPGAPMVDTVLVMMLRPLLVDLLVASGMPDAEARGLLPEV